MASSCDYDSGVPSPAGACFTDPVLPEDQHDFAFAFLGWLFPPRLVVRESVAPPPA